MKKFFTIASALFLATSLSAKVVYVATDGNNSNDGSTWDNAVADIQKAYTLANAGDEIWIAGGTYTMTDGSALLVDMKDQVNVYGSFQKGDASIDARVRPDAVNKPYEFDNPTIFTTEGVTLSQRPFGRSNTTDEWVGAILDGLSFSDMATSNGKLLFLQTGVTMQNCIVKNCGGTEIIVYFEGNGLMKDCLVEGCYSLGSDKTKFYAVRLCASAAFKKINNIENVTFKNNKDGSSLHLYNYAEGNGRSYVKNCTVDGNTNYCLAFKNDGASTPVLVDHCLFENNKCATAANTVGEGVVFTGNSASAVAITNCIIRNNENTAAATADSKNAIIALNGGSMKLVNCLIHNNKSNRLNIYVAGHMINNTVVNNIGSVGAATKSMGDYINNIFVNNTPTEGNTVFTADSESNIEFIYNGIAETDVTIANDNAYADYYISGIDASSFVNPTSTAGLVTNEEAVNADFSLNVSSPAINAGLWNYDGYDAYPELYVGYIDGTEIHDEAVAAYQKDLAGNVRVEDGKISLGAYQGAKTTSDIENAVLDNHSAIVYGIVGAIIVETEEMTNAFVYDMTGSLIKTVTINAGSNTIPVAGNGLYLIKVGNAAYKTIVK